MEPITVTQLFDAPLEKVWSALCNEEELRKWYFPVEDYDFSVGSEFSFYESADSKNYLHKCRFLNIIPNKLIEYTWTHPTHSKGTSTVKWEISAQGEKTKVTLTHAGIENFADAGEAFSKENYQMGWDAIVKTLLRNYLHNILKLEFKISINAPAEKVWQKLWDKESYKTWTNPFCEGSYYEGEMQLGNRIHFLSPSGEGMYSDVAFLKENEIAIVKHIGAVKDDQEMPMDEETEKWTGCFEIYKLKEENGKTNLTVEVDSVEKYADYMNQTFPKALEKLKEIAEQ